jgi:hypothetical protein
MDSGWIKIYRKTQEKSLWLSEKFTRGQAWIDLILLANHKDGFIRVRNNKIPVKRGCVGWSVLSLSKRWKWSRGKTQRFLDELEMEQQIVQQKNNISSVILLVNYEEYQGKQNNKQSNRRTTDGQQTDTNKNEKNEKKEYYIALKPEWISTEDWKDLFEHKKKNKGRISERTVKNTLNELTLSRDAGLNITKCVNEYLDTSWKAYKHEWMVNRLDGKDKGQLKANSVKQAQVLDMHNMACKIIEGKVNENDDTERIGS